MKYTKESLFILLAYGDYKGYQYAIISHGTHPTAYVRIPQGHPYFKKDTSEIELYVHGGFTYSGKAIWEEDNNYWIGWDYAHAGDFLPFLPGDKGKKWTTRKVFNEVKSLIHQLLDLGTKTQVNS